MTQGHAKEEWIRLTEFPLGKKQEQRKPTTHTHVFRALKTSVWHSVLGVNKGLGTSFFLLSHFYLPFSSPSLSFLGNRLSFSVNPSSYLYPAFPVCSYFGPGLFHLCHAPERLSWFSHHFYMYQALACIQEAEMLPYGLAGQSQAKKPYCCYWGALRAKCPNIVRVQG